MLHSGLFCSEHKHKLSVFISCWNFPLTSILFLYRSNDFLYSKAFQWWSKSAVGWQRRLDFNQELWACCLKWMWWEKKTSLHAKSTTWLQSGPVHKQIALMSWISLTNPLLNSEQLLNQYLNCIITFSGFCSKLSNFSLHRDLENRHDDM